MAAMASRKERPWSSLAPITTDLSKNSTTILGSATMKRSFASIVQGTNVLDSTHEPLLMPYIKDDCLCIPLPEAIYQESLKKCHNHLWLLIPKGSSLVKVLDSMIQLSSLWSFASDWNLVSLGRGFYEFYFESLEDLY